jgi:hypothetical protein
VTAEGAGSLTAWKHFAFTLTYAKGTGTTTVITYVDATANSPTELTDFVVIEDSGSLGAVGARHDGNGSGSGFTAASFFTGFIYSLSVKAVAKTSADIASAVETSSCTGGTCSACPTSNGNICLWLCTTVQYFDGSACAACSGCKTGGHENTWDGCVGHDNCNVCDNAYCLTCPDFESGSCGTCVTNASGEPG